MLVSTATLLSILCLCLGVRTPIQAPDEILTPSSRDECEYGRYTAIELLGGSGKAYFELFNEGGLVLNITTGGDHFCIPHTKYHYAYTDTVNTYLIVRTEDGDRLHTAFMGRHGANMGSFSNVESDPLAISFPSVVSVLPGVEKKLLITTSGVVDEIAISPELPLDTERFGLTATASTEGSTTYTITAKHGDSTVSASFTVYCGICPEGTVLIRTKVFQASTLYALPEVETAVSNGGEQSFCIREGSTTVRYYEIQMDDYNEFLVTEDGHRIYEFVPDGSYVLYYSFSFIYHHPITFASPLSYFVGKPNRHWSEADFKEKGWSQASGGKWGEFGGKNMAFFRGSFSVDDVEQVSYLILKLCGDGDAEVFVNGVSQGEAKLLSNTEYTRMIVIASTLHTGVNVLAVRLIKGSSSAILFALSAELNNAHQIQLDEGSISVIQEHPDPTQNPEDAFGNKTQKWVTKDVSSELVYAFKNTQQTVNRIMMLAPRSLKGFSMKVFGVTGATRTLLGTFIANSFESGWGPSTLDLPSAASFASYHFLFEQSENSSLTVSNIRLFSRAIFACPKARGLKSVFEGITVFKRCPFGFTGRKKMTCVRSGFGAEWSEDDSECFVKNPESGLEFVDWTFTIKNLPETQWEQQQKALTELLVKNTYLRAVNVKYLYGDWGIEGQSTVMKMTCRCTVDTLFGELIQRDLKRLAPVFEETVKEEVGRSLESSIQSIRLRHHVNWPVVIGVTVVVVVVSTVGVLYYALRMKKGSVRKLRKEGNWSSEKLLSLCVCKKQERYVWFSWRSRSSPVTSTSV